MTKYGRFTGGTHFKKMKNRKFNPKKVKQVMVTIEQLEILKSHDLSFQLNSMTKIKAQELIDKLSKVENAN